MGMIKKAEFVKSCTQLEHSPNESNMPEYAFIGRSNVGKSTLINMLTGNKKLAKTSQKPGKTQLINYFLIDDEYYIVDLPGYGYAKTSKKMRTEFESIIRHYIFTNPSLTLLFVLLDIRHEPQKNDLEFIQKLGEEAVPFYIIFTKCDKLKSQDLDKNVTKYKTVLSETWDVLPEMILSSGVKTLGKEEILKHIEIINQKINH